MAMVLANDCRSDVSPVIISDSGSGGSCTIYIHFEPGPDFSYFSPGPDFIKLIWVWILSPGPCPDLIKVVRKTSPDPDFINF